MERLTFLFDKSFEPYVSVHDICSYFGTAQSTTSQNTIQYAICSKWDTSVVNLPHKGRSKAIPLISWSR
ncbi:MAG: DUF6398 domain-containing protein [Paenibacillaceae bacterium]